MEDRGRWAKDYIELVNGSRIRAIGWRSKAVRGMNRQGWRISLFIGDDPEDVDDMDNHDISIKNERWLNRTVVPRLDREVGKVRVIGTMLAKHCMLGLLENDPRWRGRRYKALIKTETGEEKSYWEDKFPTEYLLHERETWTKAGKLEDWMFERQNEPPEYAEKKILGYGFHHGEYARWNGQNMLVSDEFEHPIPVYVYLAVDPAFGKDEEKHDPRAMVVFAKGRVLKRSDNTGDPYWLNKIWILEEVESWMEPASVIGAIMDYHKKYYLDAFVLEAIGGQQIYESLMDRYLSQDVFFARNPVQPVFPKYQPANKKKRIFNSLQPKAKLGQIDIKHEHVKIKMEFDNYDIIENPNLLDALEFGNRFTTECTVDHDKAQREHYRREVTRRKGFDELPGKLGYIPNTLGKLGIGRAA